MDKEKKKNDTGLLYIFGLLAFGVAYMFYDNSKKPEQSRQETIETLELENKKLKQQLDKNDAELNTQGKTIAALEEEIAELKAGIDEKNKAERSLVRCSEAMKVKVDKLAETYKTTQRKLKEEKHKSNTIQAELNKTKKLLEKQKIKIQKYKTVKNNFQTLSNAFLLLEQRLKNLEGENTKQMQRLKDVNAFMDKHKYSFPKATSNAWNAYSNNQDYLNPNFMSLNKLYSNPLSTLWEQRKKAEQEKEIKACLDKAFLKNPYPYAKKF